MPRVTFRYLTGLRQELFSERAAGRQLGCFGAILSCLERDTDEAGQGGRWLPLLHLNGRP